MSSIFSGSERITPSRWQALTPKLPLGSALIVLGIVLLLFGLFLGPLVPADLPSGHRFWVRIVAADEAFALALIVTGYIKNYLGPTQHRSAPIFSSACRRSIWKRMDCDFLQSNNNSSHTM